MRQTCEFTLQNPDGALIHISHLSLFSAFCLQLNTDSKKIAGLVNSIEKEKNKQ